MRHRNTGRQLSRNTAHRHAMLRNMSASLLRHETIRTTLPKAKELRREVEPLITYAKTDGVSRRRVAFARCVIAGRHQQRAGRATRSVPAAYTRILARPAPRRCRANGAGSARRAGITPPFRQRDTRGVTISASPPSAVERRADAKEVGERSRRVRRRSDWSGSRSASRSSRTPPS